MVLEDTYDTSSSRDYSSAATLSDEAIDSQLRYQYSLDSLPKLCPLAGGPSMRESLDYGLAKASTSVSRRLTDPEVASLAYQVALGRSVISWTKFLGYSAALARLYQHRNILRLPFVDLGKRGFTFNKFGPFQGQRARLGWQILRASCYVPLGGTLGTIVGVSWTSSHFNTAMRADPDLKDFLADMVKSRTSSTGGILSTSDSNRTSQMRRTEDMETTFEAQHAASTTRKPGSRMVSETTVAPQRDTLLTGYEEDSPTGGLGPLELDEKPKDDSAGNAWDRVRQRAAPSRFPNNKSQESWQLPRKDEQDRQQSRAEAQRAFDEQLDRERQGVSATEHDSKRW